MVPVVLLRSTLLQGTYNLRLFDDDGKVNEAGEALHD